MLACETKLGHPQDQARPTSAGAKRASRWPASTNHEIASPMVSVAGRNSIPS